jgi:hypothetical protein
MIRKEKRSFRSQILPFFLEKNWWINSLPLVALLITAAAPLKSSANSEFEERGYNLLSTPSQIVLKGEDILGGQGVSVIYPEQGPLDFSGYIPFQYQCTAGGCYQCIEFTLWLYEEQLGYPYKWPGAIWSPYQLIGVVQTANQVAYQVESGLLSPESAQYLLYEPYTDLEYYPNGSPVPPQAGDILISADGGHSMVVNRVGGDQLEIVQQNAWELTADPQPVPLEMRQVYDSSGSYSVQNNMGWIHSPRWEVKFAQTEAVQASDESIQWTRNAAALNVNLSADYLTKLAASPLGETPYLIAHKLSNSGALQFTNLDYITCTLRQLGSLLQREASLREADALQIDIPYFGSTITIVDSSQPSSGTPLEYPLNTCGWNG